MRHTDKAGALATAQRDMRSGGRYSHPYFCGTFVLVGRGYGERG